MNTELLAAIEALSRAIANSDAPPAFATIMDMVAEGLTLAYVVADDNTPTD